VKEGHAGILAYGSKEPKEIRIFLRLQGAACKRFRENLNCLRVTNSTHSQKFDKRLKVQWAFAGV
jgi:hypothetical protein